MMKFRSIIVLILVAVSTAAWGQSFEVSNDNSFSGQIGKEIPGELAIRNLTETPILIGIKRVESTIGTGQQTWFCINDNCYEPETEEAPVSIEIAPGETFRGFRSVLSAGLGQGYSTVKYIVYDKRNPSNEFPLEVNYSVTDHSEVSALFSSRQLILNDVYPNPVSDFAIVDYAILDPESEAKIVIHSVLGSIIGEYKLQPLETNLKINAGTFNPGVYFYTLYIENDGVMTRKLIVRK